MCTSTTPLTTLPLPDESYARAANRYAHGENSDHTADSGTEAYVEGARPALSTMFSSSSMLHRLSRPRSLSTLTAIRKERLRIARWSVKEIGYHWTGEAGNYG